MSDSGSFDLVGDSSSSNSSYVYLDEEGNELPPRHDDEMDVTGDGGEEEPDGAVTQYVECPLDFERERLQAANRLREAMVRINTYKDAALLGKEETTPADDHAAEPHQEGVVDDEADPVKSTPRAPTPITTTVPIMEDSGSNTLGYEGEGEDEWILEEIVDSRVVKGNKGKGGDYAAFYDDFGNKTSGMYSDGHTEYLCKWKWYADPTWELKEYLEDEGFLREVRSFEEGIIKAKADTAAASQQALVKRAIECERESEEATKNKKSPPFVIPKILVVTDPNSYPYFGDDSYLTSIVGIDPQDISERFAVVGTEMVGYGCCATRSRIVEFLHLFLRLVDTHRPMIVFHAARPCQLDRVATSGISSKKYPLSISEVGLPTPRLIAKCGNGLMRSMFLCIGLVSVSDETAAYISETRGIVFPNNDYILPLWLVDFLVVPQTSTNTSRAVSSPPPRHVLGLHHIRMRAYMKWFIQPSGCIKDVNFKKREKAKLTAKGVARTNREAEKARAAMGN